jgi:hypothetical protein
MSSSSREDKAAGRKGTAMAGWRQHALMTAAAVAVSFAIAGTLCTILFVTMMTLVCNSNGNGEEGNEGDSDDGDTGMKKKKKKKKNGILEGYGEGDERGTEVEEFFLRQNAAPK